MPGLRNLCNYPAFLSHTFLKQKPDQFDLLFQTQNCPEDVMQLPLKMGEGATSQAIQRLQKLGKVKEWIFPWSLQKKHSPAKTLIFNSEIHFWISNLQNCNIFLLFEATKFVTFCYSNKRKVIYQDNPYNVKLTFLISS